MNRDFFLPQITPAKARMMVMASRIADLHVSPSIAERAHEGRLTVESIASHLDLDPIGLDICQFIADYQHRCVIPFDYGQDQVMRAIASMVPKDREVIFLTDDPVLWVRKMGEKITPFSEKNTDRLQHLRVRDLKPAEMTRARSRYVVANITPEHIGYEWLGKLFPQMVIYCEHGDQYTLPLGGTQMSAPKHAASILYMPVLAAFERDRNLKIRGNAALPLIGCFNGLLLNAKKKTGFRLKKYSELNDRLDDLF